MKVKIFQILVCMLMIIATVIPATGTSTNNYPQSAPQPDIEWDATYGSERIDWGNCIQPTSDGGYIISGTYFRNAWSLWYSYFYLLKIDADGNEEWNQTYGIFNSEHVAKSIQQTNDGGYIIAGYQGVTYQYDAVVQKTDANGNLEWEKSYGDANAYDIAQSAQQTADGGYIVTGMTSSYGSQASDILLLKLDVDGNQEWIKTIGGTNQESGNCVRQTSDGGYVIIGETNSYGANGDVYLVKTDASGNEEWNQTFGGNGWDSGLSVEQTTDDGFILSGSFRIDVEDSDVYLIKTDASGNEEWSNTFGGSEYDDGYSVQQTSDGGYFITGSYTDTVNLDFDVYLIKTDASGNEEWNKIIDNGDTEDVGYYGIETSDGGYIITGYTGFYMQETLDVWVIKLAGENQAPNPPSIDGPQDGNAGTEYDYTFITTDPDDDKLYYYIDWGDNTSEEWIGPYNSDEEITVSHIWEEQGTYVVKAKAKDTKDAESEWGTLEITMPVSKNIFDTPLLQFIKQFIDRFPNAFPLLRYLLRI